MLALFMRATKREREWFLSVSPTLCCEGEWVRVSEWVSAAVPLVYWHYKCVNNLPVDTTNVLSRALLMEELQIAMINCLSPVLSHTLTHSRTHSVCLSVSFTDTDTPTDFATGSTVKVWVFEQGQWREYSEVQWNITIRGRVICISIFVYHIFQQGLHKEDSSIQWGILFISLKKEKIKLKIERMILVVVVVAVVAFRSFLMYIFCLLA